MELKSLDPATRRTMRRAMLAFVIFFIVTDWVFFFVYVLTGTLEGTISYYITWHVMAPICVNLLSYLTATLVDKNSTGRFTEERKNYVCTFAFFAMASGMSFFHAYFPPLWCAPAIVMMFASCFRDPRMQRIQLGFCFVITTLSAIYICVERPDDIPFYVENGIVVIVMDVVLFLISEVVQNNNIEMLRMTTEYFDQQKEYKRRLEYDNLTSVLTRPFFQAAADEMLRWARKDHPISIAIIDIDNFKHVNDTYGHDNGDVVLRELGRLMNNYVNDQVIAGRYGGEEFVFAFSSGNPKEAEDILNSLREDFGRSKYEFMNEKTTFSGGLNTVYWVTDFEDAFVGADDALYDSKNNGKNQVTKYMGKSKK